MVAQTGLASRRKAEDIIRAGRVLVNGTPVLLPQHQVDVLKDKVTVDGKPTDVKGTKYYYFALNKPKGFICSSTKVNMVSSSTIYGGGAGGAKEQKPAGAVGTAAAGGGTSIGTPTVAQTNHKPLTTPNNP